jgi:hypothetical protein
VENRDDEGTAGEEDGGEPQGRQVVRKDKLRSFIASLNRVGDEEDQLDGNRNLTRLSVRD